MSNMKIFLNGLLKENPVLVLMIGMCPSLAITTAAFNGIGMGLATTFVLLGSNVVISLLKKVIPKEVRLPSYIVIIAGFVTIIGFLLERYFPDLNKSLGMYVALIVVNCIILMRAETFASKNSVGKSAIDALGCGLGFTLALVVIGSIREILGAGSWFGMQILPESIPPMTIFVNPAGGFFVLGIVIAVVNLIMNTRGRKPKVKSCETCGGCTACSGQEGGAE
ncbi:electron transport complex, RnfABCDGE type, E subunit [[Clostridium] methylpentosum DSM 5476]|jgi:Na+-translocating ferredoxin:NAD+ oxidoreductase subunit E|uniref:Ion-translocating oxidoreductase complex subunit E n=1 Tax=[Clostridium] methylpentosum DSM 5476 TaxID=537013 RepID=C0ECT0_9FIRM|nr:electron transport complex, RnfABCDGE type, E subunit [[Clostridium] methylpentosum DSM 5476]MDY3989732.1 electron transport complex subunit E [Massilioclostridium sp.]MEE1491018.1 electron transport complex subunit E [Massilioclostridium sp.]